MGLRELGANVIEQAKRLPWWAWLLIIAGVYLGYKLITADQSGADQSSDPLAGVLDTTGPASSPGDLGLVSPPLPTLNGNDITGDNTSDSGLQDNFGDQGVTPPRVIQQGYDIRDAARARQQALDAANAAQAARSRQQGLDLRQRQAELAQQRAAANAAQAARSRQQGQDIRARQAELARQQQNKRLPGGLHQDAGIGGGPDAHYQVRKGDDLYSIASHYDVSADDIYAANRDKIDASVREAGLAGFGVYALPAIGEGLDLVIPGAML